MYLSACCVFSCESYSFIIVNMMSLFKPELISSCTNDNLFNQKQVVNPVQKQCSVFIGMDLKNEDYVNNILLQINQYCRRFH